MVGNLIPEKRYDRFLRALSKARNICPGLSGFIVGDGIERTNLERLAESLGLIPDGIEFIGRKDNIPYLLSQADFLVISSDIEGMPNVILEAMAAKLPVITTPAGDASFIVKNEETGFVVPFDRIDILAKYMVHLSTHPELRHKFGQAGRRLVEQSYGYEFLGTRLLEIYKEIALQKNNNQVIKALANFL